LVIIQKVAFGGQRQLFLTSWKVKKAAEKIQKLSFKQNKIIFVSLFRPGAVLRIRDPVPFWPLDLGSGMGKKSGSWSGIRDEQPGSYFRELKNNFLGSNTLLLWCWSGIRDGKNWVQRSGIIIPDPQRGSGGASLKSQFVKNYKED
jgi:hypothetical protein